MFRVATSWPPFQDLHLSVDSEVHLVLAGAVRNKDITGRCSFSGLQEVEVPPQVGQLLWPILQCTPSGLHLATCLALGLSSARALLPLRSLRIQSHSCVALASFASSKRRPTRCWRSWAASALHVGPGLDKLGLCEQGPCLAPFLLCMGHVRA